MGKNLLRLFPIAFALEVSAVCGRIGLARAAAALAYFLILTLFPFLMCVNFFLSLLPLDPAQIYSMLEPLLPRESLSLMVDYLTYVSGIPAGQARPMLLASLFTIVLSASAGLRTLFQTMDELYQVRRRENGSRLILSAVLSVLLLLAVYLSIVVIFTGDWFFRLLEEKLPAPILALIPLAALSGLWRWLRYLVLFCAVLLLVLAVYHVGTPLPYRREHKPLRAAALLASGTMALCSGLFSWFIGMSSRYSLVYGSLASLIILLVWLYFCGSILLLGAVLGWLGMRGKVPGTPRTAGN